MSSATDLSLPILIEAPARLHFGLLSFGQPARRQFGGIGTMLAEPALRLHSQPATTWELIGNEAPRLEALIERCSLRLGIELDRLPPQRIEVLSAPRAHLGLGSGTQLSLSIAALLLKLSGQQITSAAQLARVAGRGERSAVGSHGFIHGGFIAEAGKLVHDTLGPLISRLTLPLAWRVLLIMPRVGAGLHGTSEQQTFANLPPVPTVVSDQLAGLIYYEILPAIQLADFARFCESIFAYGHLAGNCFATVQGGPFASPQIEQRVNIARAHGCHGVGQSSWGPLIFSWHESECAADEARATLQQLAEFAECEFQIVTPAQHGATINRKTVEQFV
jgi:beta-ribofuranosylaminobenzene 5'-phosphate synthase